MRSRLFDGHKSGVMNWWRSGSLSPWARVSSDISDRDRGVWHSLRRTSWNTRLCHYLARWTPGLWPAFLAECQLLHRCHSFFNVCSHFGLTFVIRVSLSHYGPANGSSRWYFIWSPSLLLTVQRIWNGLPHEIRHCNTLPCYKSHLKTYTTSAITWTISTSLSSRASDCVFNDEACARQINLWLILMILTFKACPGFFIVGEDPRSEGWERGEVPGNGAPTPSHQLGGLGERCEFLGGVRGRASTAHKSSTIFSTQDGLCTVTIILLIVDYHSATGGKTRTTLLPMLWLSSFFHSLFALKTLHKFNLIVIHFTYLRNSSLFQCQ